MFKKRGLQMGHLNVFLQLGNIGVNFVKKFCHHFPSNVRPFEESLNDIFAHEAVFRGTPLVFYSFLPAGPEPVFH